MRRHGVSKIKTYNMFIEGVIRKLELRLCERTPSEPLEISCNMGNLDIISVKGSNPKEIENKLVDKIRERSATKWIKKLVIEFSMKYDDKTGYNRSTETNLSLEYGIVWIGKRINGEVVHAYGDLNEDAYRGQNYSGDIRLSSYETTPVIIDDTPENRNALAHIAICMKGLGERMTDLMSANKIEKTLSSKFVPMLPYETPKKKGPLA
jgi:hypothetical protein